MQPSDWITLASVFVAALGIGATVFTQVWQSRQESRRAAVTASEARTARWLETKRDLYAHFLSSAGDFQAKVGLDGSLVMQGDIGSLRGNREYARNAAEVPLPGVGADAILNEMELLAPDSVLEPARYYFGGLREVEMMIDNWVIQDDPTADDAIAQSITNLFEECFSQRDQLVTAMREDLR